MKLLGVGTSPGRGAQPLHDTHLSFWVDTWLLRASASQSACGLMVAWTDEPFAQNSAERGLMEIPQHTIRTGLRSPRFLQVCLQDPEKQTCGGAWGRLGLAGCSDRSRCPGPASTGPEGCGAGRARAPGQLCPPGGPGRRSARARRDATAPSF